MRIILTIKYMYEKTETKTYRTESNAEITNTLVLQLYVIALITLAITILNLGLTCGQIINGGFRRTEPSRDSRKGRGRRRSNRQSNRQPNRQHDRVGGRCQNRTELTPIERGIQRAINRANGNESQSDDFTTDNGYAIAQ